MKKGFTLVEIIISISLILLVGISTIFFIFNNKNNKELISITKEILEAANLYANKEVDESGNIYLNEVRNGKKGIKIPLTNLVNKGYIDESLENQVKKLTNEDNYYVMLLDGNDESIDYCEDGSILTLASWIDEDKNKDVYLCEDNKKDGDEEKEKTLIEMILSDYPNVQTKDTITYEDYKEYRTFYYSSYSNQDDPYFYISHQNGLLKTSNEVYYFRGEVEDNYVKINDEIFRIINFNKNDNTIKLIKENSISLYYSNSPDVNRDIDFFNKEFKNTLIYSTIESWFFDKHAYKVNENGESVLDEKFITSDFCQSKFNNTNNSANWSLTLENICNGITINSKVGLITTEEAIYAGVLNQIMESDYLYDNVTKDYNHLWLGKHWLNSGDSVLTLSEYYYSDTYGTTQQPIIIINYMQNSNSNTYDSNAIVFKGSFIRVEENVFFKLSNDVNVATTLRPVIVLDNTKTKVTGKGTKNNPYLVF